MQRPSHAECEGKIFKARAKVADDDWTPASPAKLLPEFAELALLTAEERQAGLLAALGEIRPEDYAGYRPPQTSYEEPCREAELFAFQWSSSHFKRGMYLKFCFVKETLYIVSFHESRVGKERTS